MIGRIAALASLMVLIGSAQSRADVTISANPTQNMTCSAGVCSPTATAAVLNVSDLVSLLASGATTITTTGSGAQANNIAIDSALRWSSGNALILDAHESITVATHITVSKHAALTLTTNDSGSGGVLSFGAKGAVMFSGLKGALTINGSAYKLVGTVKNLAVAIAKNPAGNFALASGYDAGKDGTYRSAPVHTTFTGKLEGLGNTISNLQISDQNQADYVGLFASTDTGAVVENLRLNNVNISGGNYMGALIGFGNASAIYGDSVSGTIDVTLVGPGSTGGLIGFVANSTVTSCVSSATITGFTTTGGLIGIAEDTTTSDSHSTGAVSGGAQTGGLVGYNLGGGTSGLVTNSYATGSVTDTGSGAAGGLVGYNFGGSTTNSFATGATTGGDSSDVGGLVGYQDGGTLINSYATGAVAGGASSGDGGLVGYMVEYSFEYTYSTGTVSGGSGSYVGGLVGIDSRATPISDTYWDTTTSGITNLSQGAGNVPNDPGITGLTTAQLQSGLPTGFDSGTWAEKKKINDGLPYLIANRPPK